MGGGFIKGPLLLYLNMRPVAAAATSATMIFFTSLVATTSYFAFGIFPFLSIPSSIFFFQLHSVNQMIYFR